MPEQHWHMPEGLRPLQARAHRLKTAKQPQELTLPEVHVTVGRDLQTSGLTLAVWEPTAGDWPTYKVLYAARWLAPILSTEQAVRLAANGLAAAVAELFGPELPS
jgi:hypothetical protein